MMHKKEHLLHFMLKGYVHLSKKDYGFFNNLAYIVKDKKQVTSNQNKLFDKLILKYQRQLRKLNQFNVDTLPALNWDVAVIDSSDQYLVPKIYIEGNDIVIRSPFNSKFIQAFKNSDDNTFIWNKEQKVYRSHFYTHALRLAYDLCKTHFTKLDFCDLTVELLKDVWVHEGVSKAPILCVDEGKYYIKNSNRFLDIALSDITLNNDPKTLFELSRYGVGVSDMITNNDPLLTFASNFVTKMDVDDFIKNADLLRELDIKTVCAPVRYLHRGKVKEDLMSFFKENDISIYNDLESFTGDFVLVAGNISTSMYNIEMQFGKESKRVAKIIILYNSRPIEIR